MKKILILLLLLLSISANARIRYVSTRGNDSNTGIDSSSTGAWATWKKGFAEAYPGDTIYFMGGVYYSTGKIILNPENIYPFERGVGRSGTAENPIMFASYPGQWAILDCRYHCDYAPYRPHYNSAIEMYFVRNIHLKDFEVRNVYQCDSVNMGAISAYLSCYLTFEHIVLHNVGSRGWAVESGAFKTFWEEGHMEGSVWQREPYWDFDIDTIRWINCDTYDLCDSLDSFGRLGNGADAFHTSMYPENVYIWEGCRTWNVSDDCFNIDGGAGGKRIIKNCWIMPSNKYYYSDGNWETERNGVKCGWNSGWEIGYTGPLNFPLPDHNTIEVSNCLVMFAEQAFREGPNNLGFYHNNTIYGSKYGFLSMMNTSGTYNWRPSYKNNLVFKPTTTNSAGLPSIATLSGPIPYDAGRNSWVVDYSGWPWWTVSKEFYTDVTYKDFVGLTGDWVTDSLYLVSLFLAPRKPDGSLPDQKPLMLKEGSRLIDAGTPYISVGKQPEDKILSTSEYYGSAPDIGYAEYKSELIFPALPTFVSAIIQNATPTRLEMTYTLPLANIIPSTTAFTVRVNNTARSVNSVSISGTKVYLNLASPIVYGDMVTVSYTKPQNNPLQTSAGGQAAILNSTNVTNNVAAPAPAYINSVIENATPSRLEMTFSLTLANVVPSVTAFTVRVNNTARNVNSVSISGRKVYLNLASPVVYGDVITVSYTRPPNNPLQSTVGGQAETLTTQTVLNNCRLPANQPPVANVSSPSKNDTFTAPATIIIDAMVYDPDGNIVKVEFFNGQMKLGEILNAPYSFTWKDVPEGAYSIYVTAIDNKNTRTVSAPVAVVVESTTTTAIQNPEIDLNIINQDISGSRIVNIFPNPTEGCFYVNMSGITENERRFVVYNLSGQILYSEQSSGYDLTKEFNLSELPAGTFILVVSSGQKITDSRKIIKR